MLDLDPGFGVDLQEISCGVVSGCEPARNIKGNSLNRAPKFTLSLGAEYSFEFGDAGTLTPRFDYHWQDKIYFREFQNPLDRQASYASTNVRIKVEPLNGNWWLEIYGKNLENNETIKTQLENRGAQRQWKLRASRTFGVRTGYRFY